MSNNRPYLNHALQAQAESMIYRWHQLNNDPVCNPTDKGEQLEFVVSSFLEGFLPRRFGVNKGYIVGADGQKSRQQDVIIFDALSGISVATPESQRVYPIEHVLATIEVKARLDREQLDRCEKNQSTVKAFPWGTMLKINQQSGAIEEIEAFGSQVSCIGFFFETSLSACDVANAVRELAPSLDYIIVLGRVSVCYAKVRDLKDGHHVLSTAAYRSDEYDHVAVLEVDAEQEAGAQLTLFLQDFTAFLAKSANSRGRFTFVSYADCKMRSVHFRKLKP